MLTGTNAALAASMKSAIEAKLTAITGQPMMKPEFLQAICEGIAESVVTHLVSNVMVRPGQTVTGTAGVNPVIAATATPGQIL